MTPEIFPAFYSQILIWGDGTDRSRGRGCLRARVGGKSASPILSRSYLLAARRLLDAAEIDPTQRVDVVAFPIGYMQRHAFELALKEVVSIVCEIDRDARWMAAMTEHREKAVVPPLNLPKRIKLTHEFDEILGLLGAALTLIGYDPAGIPTEFRVMGERLTAVEEKRHTRMRYGDFENPVKLELGALLLTTSSDLGRGQVDVHAG